MRTDIFWPMVALAGLTAAVWVLMYIRRISEMRSARIDPQSLATSDKALLLKNVTAADNLRNLFEVPILFYAICLCLAITGTVTPLQLTLAWLFVVLRGLHTLIHVTYNRVIHRFAIYVASTVCLFVMWVIFALTLWSLDG